MLNPFIAGDRIYLRPLELDDIDPVVSWLNDEEIRECLGKTSPLNRIREKEYLEKLYKDDRNVVLGIMLKEGDQLIGVTGLHDISIPHGRAELGIFIGDKSCWSEGYGPEAINLMLGYGFDQINLHRVYLVVLEFNKRAVRAYEKVGFKMEAAFREHGYRNGKYCDDCFMGILRSEWREGR